MADPSDVVVGLDIDAREIRAAGFDLSGRELALVRRPVVFAGSDGGVAEIDPARLWQTLVRAVRQLADRVPDLGRRTVAIGLSGALGGLCLIDEDGDPLFPAISPLDRRRASRPACPDRAGRGRLLDARIGLVAGSQPGLLDEAADALTPKDWIFFCLTGERAAEPIEARLTFGSDAAATLARSGLAQHVALPAPPAAAALALPLGAAASAVTGWWEETPVVLAPPGPLAAAVALGAASLGSGTAISVLDHDSWHGGIAPETLSPDELAMPVGGGMVHLRQGRVGGDAIAWLGAQVDGLLADAGLIGQSGDELRALIDERAGAALPGRILFRVGDDLPGAAGGWSFSGLDPGAALPDLMRAIYEAIGAAAAEAMADGRPRLEAVAAAGDLAGSSTVRRIIAATLGLPLRRLTRDAPAATGAAMVAAVACGAMPALEAAGARWVEPYLTQPEPPDPELREVYARRREALAAA